MKTTIRAAALAAALSGAAAPAFAQQAPGMVAGAKTWAHECGACHMAYPPFFLPARSWSKLLDHLSHHFGEDASLDPATTSKIKKFLMANAADSPSGNPEILRGLPASVTPVRITDMPFWRRIHGWLLGPGVGSGPGIRTAAKCNACHNGRGGTEGGGGGGE